MTPTADPSPDPSPSASPGQATTFSSPLYGYTVTLPAGWTATAATVYADDPASTDATATDMVPVPGTDTTIGILGWPLGTESYADWAKAFHEDTVANVPDGCDGGDPAKWPPVPVGSATGYWVEKCNEVVAIVPVGRRVYVLTWGNQTFNSGSHLPIAQFKAFLLGVRLPEASAAQSPLWVPSQAP